MASQFIGALLVGVGGLTVYAMAKDWGFMFNSDNPEDAEFNLLVRVFGRKAIRVFYIILGLFLIALGVAGLLGAPLVQPKG